MLISGSGVDRGTYFWIEGANGDNATTGKHVFFGYTTMFVVVGTKTFKNTTGGSSTVKHLVAVDSVKADEVQEKIRQLRLFRSWTGKDGKPIGLAKATKSSDGKVYLLRYEDGITVDYPITNLNDGDRKWLTNYLRSEKEAKSKAKKR
jgi:hypothetical protein